LSTARVCTGPLERLFKQAPEIGFSLLVFGVRGDELEEDVKALPVRVNRLGRMAAQSPRIAESEQAGGQVTLGLRVAFVLHGKIPVRQ
jgi:hypothetical protein